MSTSVERKGLLGFSFDLLVPLGAERPPLLRLALDLRIRRLDLVLGGLITFGVLGLVVALVRTEGAREQALVQGERPLGVVRAGA